MTAIVGKCLYEILVEDLDLRERERERVGKWFLCTGSEEMKLLRSVRKEEAIYWREEGAESRLVFGRKMNTN